MLDMDLHFIAPYNYELVRAKPNTKPTSSPPSSPSLSEKPMAQLPNKDAFKGIVWAWEDWGVSLRQMLG
ncbi:hypothetical protein FRC07_010676 [Ceratobasidium sp. 392]|nr:hypothetical protein FRC07_010676 [Ceratobasidium sp. 392]